MDWTPPARDRVRARTSERVNRRIDRRTRAHLAHHADAPIAVIDRRLTQLEREWDIDRVLMATLGAAGGMLAVKAARGVRATGGVNGFVYAVRAPFAFLVMYSLLGWCPPVPVLRRLGFRTRSEIDAERAALEQFLQRRLGAVQTDM